MIEEQARVIKIDGKYAWIETQRQSSCGQCSAKSGCGTQVFAKVLGNKTSSVRCLNSLGVKAGDKVIIGIEESALLNGSFLMYFLPLMSMIIFAALSGFFSRICCPEETDFFAIIAAFMGLIVGMFLSRHIILYQSHQNKSTRALYEPIIIKKIPDIF